MCQGCDDFAEFQAAMDAHIAKALPAMLNRVEDVAVLSGNEPDTPKSAND